MQKWVIVNVTGMDENKRHEKVVKFSRANIMSTDEAIGYLSDFA